MTLQQGNGNGIRIRGISGSLRKASFNTGLLRAAREIASEGSEVTILDIGGLPFYDVDLEAGGDPSAVAALKNAIDWASRDRAEGSLMGEPAPIMGAVGRAGTALAQMQLQEIPAETGCVVMVKPGVLVEAFAPRQFDSEGNLINDGTRDSLRRHKDEFGKWITQVVAGRQFVWYGCEIDIQLARS